MQTIMHVVDEMLQTCRSIGITPDTDVPELAVPKEAKEFATAQLINAGVRPGERVIAIHPGGFYATQCWMPERFCRGRKIGN